MPRPQGKNWHIERGLIDRELAQRAENQAKVLRSFRLASTDCVREFTPAGHSWDRRTLTVLQVAFGAMPASDRKTFSELIEVGRRVNEEAAKISGRPGSGSEEVFLNFYSPGASTGEHHDSYAPATVAVGLGGRAQAHIWNSETQTWEPPVELAPGDAFCLKNDVVPSERPLHKVDCIGILPRVALVNASR